MLRTPSLWRSLTFVWTSTFSLQLALITRSLSPSGPGLFRKVVGETAYNGYRIPAGESIQWNTSIGCRAKSLYPEPEKWEELRRQITDLRSFGPPFPFDRCDSRVTGFLRRHLTGSLTRSLLSSGFALPGFSVKVTPNMALRQITKSSRTLNHSASGFTCAAVERWDAAIWLCFVIVHFTNF